MMIKMKMNMLIIGCLIKLGERIKDSEKFLLAPSSTSLLPPCPITYVTEKEINLPKVTWMFGKIGMYHFVWFGYQNSTQETTVGYLSCLSSICICHKEMDCAAGAS